MAGRRRFVGGWTWCRGSSNYQQQTHFIIILFIRTTHTHTYDGAKSDRDRERREKESVRDDRKGEERRVGNSRTAQRSVVQISRG